VAAFYWETAPCKRVDAIVSAALQGVHLHALHSEMCAAHTAYTSCMGMHAYARRVCREHASGTSTGI
jgi:hypothetical protein